MTDPRSRFVPKFVPGSSFCRFLRVVRPSSPPYGTRTNYRFVPRFVQTTQNTNQEHAR